MGEAEGSKKKGAKQKSNADKLKLSKEDHCATMIQIYITGGKKCACNKRDGIEFCRKFEGNRSDCSRKNLCSSVDKEGRKMTNNRGVGGRKKKKRKKKRSTMNNKIQ